MESNSAFQEALQRAKQLAAKISQPTGIKRPNEDGDPENSPDSKKMFLSGFKPDPTMMNPMNQMKNNNNMAARPSRDQLYLNGTMYNGEKILDMMLPGNKVGFVIGKGGEMIRNLQQLSGVKMVVYQDSHEASDRDKQLRISGDPEKVDQAKNMVIQLLAEKERELMQRKNRMNNNMGEGMNSNSSDMNEFRPATGQMTFLEYPVSPQLIGLVIGKGGETIRKIQADSGCKVQFDTTKVDPQGYKICQFTGAQDAVNRALDMVREIIDAASQGHGNVEEIKLIVPTSKTGSVIGRGGETIRGMKIQSGCNIELDKTFQSDNDEKCFIIRGPAEKILFAQQMVADKVGGQVTVYMSSLPNNPLLYSDGAQYSMAGQVYPASSQMAQAAAAGAGQSQYYWPNANADQKTVQEQYNMYAAYYQSYYQPQIAAANGAPQAMAAAAGAYSQDNEMVYKQWIDYYKYHGLTKEAEIFEQRLKDYQNAKNATNDDGGGGEGSHNTGGGSGSSNSSGRNQHSQNGKPN